MPQRRAKTLLKLFVLVYKGVKMKCPICGTEVAEGDMEEHKKMHEEEKKNK